MAVLVPGAAFGQQQQQVSWWDWKSGKGWDWKSGKGWEKNIFSMNSERTLGTFSVRFCGMFVLPCLAVLVPGNALATLLLAAAAAGELMGDWKSGKGWQKDIFSRNSEGTLVTFSVRFCGMFVLPCLAVLVPGGALATLLLAAAAGGLMGLKKWKRLGKRHFFYKFRRDVDNFSVRFCGMFVLPCLAVLVPGGALATLLLAAAAATAVLVRGGAFGQQQQQVSWWEIEKAEKVGKKTFFPGIQKGR